MKISHLSNQDIEHLKVELLQEIRNMLQSPASEPAWIKSSEVQKILQCSPNTLQNLRTNGILPFTKIGGTLYYSFNDIKMLLKKGKHYTA